MKSTMELGIFLEEEYNRLINEDADQVVDEFNITTHELLHAFKDKILGKLKEVYYGEELYEDSEEDEHE